MLQGSACSLACPRILRHEVPVPCAGLQAGVGWWLQQNTSPLVFAADSSRGGGLVLGNPGHGHQPAPARGKYTQNLSGVKMVVNIIQPFQCFDFDSNKYLAARNVHFITDVRNYISRFIDKLLQAPIPLYRLLLVGEILLITLHKRPSMSEETVKKQQSRTLQRSTVW